MPSLKTPTDQQIEAAVQRMRSPEFEAYFFARLENPKWILPLRDRGLFASPPPTLIVEGGGTSFPIWAASKYLVRMAQHAPDDVASILAEVETDNPFVVGDVVEAALAMPADAAATVVPTVVRAAGASALSLHFMEASDLCIHLATGGEVDAAMALAEGLFRPAFEEGHQERRRRDAHWYNEGLGKVLPVLVKLRTRPFLARLCTWLKLAVDAKDRVEGDSGGDYSFLWRQAIEEHSQNNDSDFAGNLVGVVRDGFEISVREGSLSLTEALEVLEEFSYLVFRRLRIHLINSFADSNPELARETMMDHVLFGDYRYKHEYAMLVGRRLNLLTEDERKTWFGWVNAGPDASELDDVVEEARERRVDYWRFRKLHWVREHLEGRERDFYDAMLATHGEPELADLHISTSAMAWGSVSPMIVEDLAGRTFEEAVELVASWRPQERQFMGPDVEGLASTFETYVGSAPEKFSHQAGVLVRRPAVYVRGFLSQMGEAIKGGKEVHVSSVLELCEWVVSRPPEERTVPLQDRDILIDMSWQWTRDQICRLLEVICQATDNESPRYPLEGLRERIWSLLTALYSDPSPSYIMYDDAADDPRAKDYLTLGINSPRGKAVEAGLAYARWVANHIKTEEDGHDVIPGGFEAMPEVREMLKWQLERDNRSFEALAIVGIHLGLIFWIDREWLARNAESLFDLKGIEESPPRAHGWAAWNAFLVWVRPHIEFYKLFKEQFSYSLEQSVHVEIDRASREDPMSHLGEHLVVLYGRGQLPLDEEGGIVGRFIREANPKVRRHAIGFIGRTLWREEMLPQEMVARFMTLWETYWAGPGPQDACDEPDAWLFGVWFASEQLPEEWAIQQLSAFVDVIPMPEPNHAVAERLAEIAPTDLAASVRILDKMIHGDREGWHVHMWREPARKVLASAMEAGGAAQSQAERTIDYLGRRGYPDFGELL